jgi:hypothetical protein
MTVGGAAGLERSLLRDLPVERFVAETFSAYLRLFHLARGGGPPRHMGSGGGSPTDASLTLKMQFHALVPVGHMDRAGNVLKPQPGDGRALRRRDRLTEQPSSDSCSLHLVLG